MTGTVRLLAVMALPALAGCAGITAGPPPAHRLNVFPLFYSEKGEHSATSVVFPLMYANKRDETGVYTAVFPFFRYRRQEKATDWQLLGGLAGYYHAPEEGIRRLDLPLLGWEKRPYEHAFYCFPLVSMRSHRNDPESPDFGHFSLLGPMYTHYRSEDYRSVNMLLGAFSTYMGTDKGVKRYGLRLFPLFSYSKKWEPSGVTEGDFLFERKTNIAGPFLTIHEDNYGPGYRRVDFLWPIVRFTRGYPRSPNEREITFFILPLAGWSKHWTYDEITGELTHYTNDFYLVDPLFHYHKDTTKGVSIRIIGGLLYAYKSPSGDRDFRILINIIRVAKEGDKRIVNFWPIFGTEWDPVLNTRKTIVLGGMFYYRRDPDGSVTKRILWVIPLGRRSAQEVSP